MGLVGASCLKEALKPPSAGNAPMADATFASANDNRFPVFREAYQYFETRFGLSNADALASGVAAGPGPARIAELRDLVRCTDIACVFSGPQIDPKLIQTVFPVATNVECQDSRSDGQRYWAGLVSLYLLVAGHGT